MKANSLLRYGLIAAALVSVLAGWNTPISPGVLPGRAAAAQTISDAERLQITLEVLESKAVELRQTYETTKDCQTLGGARDVVAALLALAPAKSASYRRGQSEWETIRSLGLRSRCGSGAVTPSGQAGPGAPNNNSVVVGGGGCTTGQIAELLGQEPAFIRDYAARAGLEIDLTTVSDTERILLDVTPAGRNAGDLSSFTIVQAQCDPKAPGVKGMGAAILSYPLLTQQQRDNWLKGILQSIQDFVPWSPTGGPTPSVWGVGPAWPSPTRSAFGPGSAIPDLRAPGAPFPGRILPPP